MLEIAQNEKIRHTHNHKNSYKYHELRTTLIRFNKLIPKNGLEIWEKGLRGDRVKKAKQFKNIESHIDDYYDIIADRFYDPNEQQQIINASTNFLQKLLEKIKNNTSEEDAIPLGQIDRFLTEFPMNVLGRLENPEVETVSRIFNIGSKAIDNTKNLTKSYFNHPLGTIALLVGEAIPEAFVRMGIQGQDVLIKIEDVADKLTYYELRDYIEQYQKYSELTSGQLERIAQFKKVFMRIDPDFEKIDNPFNREDREQWRNTISMGSTKRKPLWGDFGSAVKSSILDSKEYGLAISKGGPDTDTTLEFIRGAESSIKNGSRIRNTETVFFHVHPDSIYAASITSPLVSRADLDADDYGGAYLNVINTSGITFYLGSQHYEDVNKDSNTYYKVESGKLAGQLISRRGYKPQTEEESDHTLEVMENLRNLSEPYIYSIVEGISHTRYYFVHIPWEKVDVSVGLEDICFGDGLAKIMRQIDTSKNILFKKNLHSVLKSDL